MPNDDSNFPGAMQNSSERAHSENIPGNFQQQSSSSYLILSPSNPLRTFAISFLTHWIYSTVIILTICAFVTSSVYTNFWCCEVKTDLEEGSKEGLQREFTLLTWTRRILFIVILLEILIKSVARGFLVGALAYLRLAWDWLDVISLILIFVSIIIPWKAVDSAAAGIVLLKLIPIHSGSISAFTSLCSCAKKLIPVLLYGIIIVWIYGVLIFTLFVKYQQDIFEYGDSSDKSVTKANESNSDSVENENITQSRVAAVVDGDYLTPSTSKKSQNFSFGLSVECLPTNLRSLSGSLIEACQMLTLGFSQSHLTSTFLRANISNLNKLEYLCQYEIYTLSIVETLVIISGTLPMITMTFGALYNFFQKESSDGVNKLSLQQQDDNATEQESQSSYQYSQRRSLGSGISGRSNNSHIQNDFCGEGSTCLSSSFKQLANILCDCDYYFCCLANLQRRLNPCATRLLNSKRFKVCVMLVVSLDFLCMITLLWFFNSSDESIDFSLTWLITYCLQICFVLYTVDAVFKWFALGSDEYWLNVWPAFDLILIIFYWIGYTVIQVWSHHTLYLPFCGILIIRTLKIVPYCKTLQHSLKIMVSSLLGKLHKLFVILICSCSTIMLKYAICMPEMETHWSSYFFSNDNSTNLHYFRTPVNYFSDLILYFLCSAVLVCICIQTIDILKAPQQGRQHVVNPSISFLLNDSHSDELVNTQYQLQRRSLNESASPISIMSLPSGISSMKYRLAASPCESNNLLSTHETQSMLSPSSDVFSPLLSIPTSNGLNGHIQSPYDDNCPISDEANIQLGNDGRCNVIKQSSFIQCSSMEFTLDLASCGVIILSSVNIALDTSETGGYGMDWSSLHSGRSLWLEMLFITCISAHLIYKTRLGRFSRETFIQISCICDLLMVLAVAVEVFSSGMKWLPLKSGPKSVKVFVDCAKVLSAARGLLLFSRISWLKCVGSSLCKMVWSVANYLTSFGYLWLIFIICSSETQKMITSIGPVGNTGNLGTNNSDKNSSVTPNIHDQDFAPHSSLILLTLLLFLMSFGGFLGLFCHTVGGWNEVFKKYAFSNQMPSSSKLGVYPSASHFNKPTKGICVPVLYFVTNHVTFDAIVLTVILFDGIGISLEHLATSDRAFILRKHYPAYMIFLYLLELSLKLGGNGLQFFKSKWNIFDTIIITVSLADFLISFILHNHYVPVLIQNVRFLRILRIFQFPPFVHRTRLIQKLFSSVSKVSLMLRNFGMFYFSLFLVTIIFRLRCAQFISLDQNPLSWIAAPFQVVHAPTIFFKVIGNLQPESLTFEYAFFFCCLTFFSLIRASVIFGTWLIIGATLCHLLTIPEPLIFKSTEITEIPTFHRQQQRVGNGSVDFDDRYPYVMPCISPETIDIETPSSSGTNYRANMHNNDISAAVDNGEPEPTVQNSIQNNALYKTTTITSSEEINGCKVFYVEAMITTV